MQIFSSHRFFSLSLHCNPFVIHFFFPLFKLIPFSFVSSPLISFGGYERKRTERRKKKIRRLLFSLPIRSFVSNRRRVEFIQTLCKMMAIDESTTEQLLKKCSHFTVRDYRNYTRKTIEELDELLSILKAGRIVSSPSLLRIIQTIISSIDRKNLWKIQTKKNDQYRLAQFACRLFKYPCQFDPTYIRNEQGLIIIRSILQWLKDDTEFYLTKSGRYVSRDLVFHFDIIECF